MSSATSAMLTSLPEIAPEELHRRIAAGEPLDLIDVRTAAEFAAQHATSARLVPLDRLDPGEFTAGRGGRPLYVICQAGTRAKQAVQKLRAAGCAEAVLVTGGTQAWVEAGLPCVTGTSRVISLERQVRIAAGALVLVGVVLSLTVHPALVGLAALVGAGLVFAGATDWCGMGLLLARMPWNQSAASCAK